jgi:hypothetical protein
MGFQLIRRLGVLAVVVGLALVVLAPMASAQTDYPTHSTSTTDPCVTGPNMVCNTSPGVTVKAASTGSGSLAFTGGNIALLVGLGLVAAVGGVVLVRLGRRASARL